jgi:serine/alanine adding enzyme
MEVEILESADPGCDEFLKRMPNTVIYQTYSWGEMVKKAYGHKPFYLVAREGGSIHGILPLTYVHSRLFGTRMISQACSNYGGPVENSAEAMKCLYDQAVKLANEYDCDFIEFRNLELLPFEDLYLNKDKFGMRLSLPDDPDVLWKSFKKTTKVRNHINRGKRAGLVTVSGGIELLDDFYRIYTIRMHQLGSPCYSRKIMKTILEMFPENSRIFVTRLKDAAVGAFFVVNFKEWVESIWGATLIEYNNISPNHSLYWVVMKHFCLAGAKWFNFGRSTVEGPHYQFKKQWGADPYQLYYQYWVRPGYKLSVASPDNPKYQRKIEMWKKLPLWMTRLLGPYISRGLP